MVRDSGNKEITVRVTRRQLLKKTSNGGGGYEITFPQQLARITQNHEKRPSLEFGYCLSLQGEFIQIPEGL